LGRRTIFTSGMVCMCVVSRLPLAGSALMPQTLYVVAALGFHRTTETTFAMGSLLIVLNFIYNCTIGPSTYTIIGEISSTRLRQKTIVLARASYKAINIVAGILNPRMLCK